MSRIEQIAQMIVVRDGLVAVPSDRQLMRYWSEHLRPQPIIQPVEVDAAIVLALQWSRSRQQPVPSVPSVPTTGKPVAPQPTEVPAPELVDGDSAKLEYDLGTISAWKSPQLRKFADDNSLEYIVHPSNPGLTAMRARNAIASWLRHGNRLPDSP